MSIHWEQLVEQNSLNLFTTYHLEYSQNYVDWYVWNTHEETIRLNSQFVIINNSVSLHRCNDSGFQATRGYKEEERLLFLCISIIYIYLQLHYLYLEVSQD